MQVFIHHSQSTVDQVVQYVNIDQDITALCHHSRHPWAVSVGTASHLLVYDMLNNKILINKEVFLFIVE